jgi:hypothetical protein
MKTNIILIALFVATFMFPSIGSVDTADAETDTSQSANREEMTRSIGKATDLVIPAPATFDDTLMQGQRPPPPSYGTESPMDTRRKVTQPDRYEEGAVSNERSGGYGTSYRHELRENNRMRNGIPGSGRKMK